VALRLVAAAQTLNAVDRQGRTPDGTPAPGLPDAAGFLATAFSAEVGEQTLMQETDAGYFVLRVDQVTPPAPRPLETVRDRVEALWARQQKAEAMRARAETILATAREGRTLAAVAEANGARVRALPPVRRDGEPMAQAAEAPASPLVSALFDLDTTGALTLVETGDAVHVLQLDRIIEAGADAAETRARTAEAVRAGIAQDLFVQFTDALSRRQGVEINRAVIESAFQ